MDYSEIKLHILFDFKDTPWGGGNQFLKLLRKYFIAHNLYEDNAEDADAVIFDSHHNLKDVLRCRRNHSRQLMPDWKVFIHRLGPVFTLARNTPKLDKLIFRYNNQIADGTIFQSNWSRDTFRELGFKPKNAETVIMNACDPTIFYPRLIDINDKRIKLITTSWSPNFEGKGFNILQYLDRTLDFEKYSFLFLGNSPVKFENIVALPPQPAQVVSMLLASSDIFIAPSINDACSNSLIEALACGCPAVARNSGGNPEIVKKGGVMFEGKDDILEAINSLGTNVDKARTNISVPLISEVGAAYFNFAMAVYNGDVSGF